MLDLNQVGIDINNPEHRKIADDMQGNILHGHGREQARHIFLQFHPDHQEQARRWIQNEFSLQITTLSSQLLERNAKKEDPSIQSSVFRGFMLSAMGYRDLGFDDAHMPQGVSFLRGMKKAKLNDPKSITWEEGFKAQIDALVILAGNDEAQLEREEHELRARVSEFAVVHHVQAAKTLKNEAGQHTEHFGFVDGISQPTFLADQIEAEEVAHGAAGWKSKAPLKLALVADPLGNPDFSTGSYCVYRKLEQDVNGFINKTEELARQLNIANPGTTVTTDEAGALAVGRFKDGTPVTKFFSPKGALNPDNNFIYANTDDKDGRRCPFQAHIRKTNPRFDSVNGEGIGKQAPSRESELAHRIVRRGIPYGNPGDSSVGLIFICFQSDIGSQFEFMQSIWANNKSFVVPETGLDPLVGQGSSSAQKWKLWNQPRSHAASFDLSDVVKLKGGEYFFTPSLTFLKDINDKALTLAPAPSMLV